MTQNEFKERLNEIKDKRFLEMAKGIIKENNINKDIKWTVCRVSDGFQFVNDYCDGCVFEVTVNLDEDGDETITMTDLKHWDKQNNKKYFFQGHDVWCDYENIEVGLSIAFKSVLKWFYYFY